MDSERGVSLQNAVGTKPICVIAESGSWKSLYHTRLRVRPDVGVVVTHTNNVEQGGRDITWSEIKVKGFAREMMNHAQLERLRILSAILVAVLGFVATMLILSMLQPRHPPMIIKNDVIQKAWEQDKSKTEHLEKNDSDGIHLHVFYQVFEANGSLAHHHLVMESPVSAYEEAPTPRQARQVLAFIHEEDAVPTSRNSGLANGIEKNDKLQTESNEIDSLEIVWEAKKVASHRHRVSGQK